MTRVDIYGISTRGVTYMRRMMLVALERLLAGDDRKVGVAGRTRGEDQMGGMEGDGFVSTVGRVASWDYRGG